MAIDPGISLQAGSNVPPADPYGAANKAMSLVDLMQKTSMQPQLLQANLENTKAATAGQQLLNTQIQRENEARVRLAEIAKKNTTVAPDGTITPDFTAIGHQAASEGMDPQTVFSYLTKGAEADQANIKTAADKQAFAKSTLDATDNILRVQDDPEQATQIAGAAHQILNKVIGKDLADQYANTHWKAPSQPPLVPNPDGTPFTGPPDTNPQAPPGTPGTLDKTTFGTHLIQQAKVNAQSQITPEQAVLNSQTAEAQAQSGQTNYNGKEYRGQTADSSPAVARLAGAIARAGLAKPEDLMQMDGTTMWNTYGNALSNNQPTGAQRLEAAGTVAAGKASVSKYDNALQHDADLSAALGGGTIVGEKAKQLYEKYVAQNPTIAGNLQGAIDEYNTRHPDVKLSISNGWNVVKQRLLQDKAQIASAVGPAAAVSKGNTGIANSVANNPEPQPGAATTGIIAQKDIDRERGLKLLQSTTNPARIKAIKDNFRKEYGENL